MKGEKPTRLGTTDGKMVGGTRDAPVDVPDGSDVTSLRRESSADGDGEEGGEVRMVDIPPAMPDEADRGGGGVVADIPKEESREELFISEDSASDEEAAKPPPQNSNNNQDDKKKTALDTTYDGFSIYGRILCLVVKRRGGAKGKEAAAGGHGTGQAMMEEWIASTQAGEGAMMDD